MKTARWMPLALVLLLALVLRCVGLDYSFWGDEIRTYSRSAHGLVYAWTCTSTPLSYVFASIGHYFGDSEACVRFPFVLLGVAGAAAAFVLGKRAGGKGTGLVFALAVAVSPYHILWSQRARYYVLIMLITVLYFLVLERVLTTDRRSHWAGYVAVCAAGILTHPTFAAFISAAGAGALAWIIFNPAIGSRGVRLRRAGVFVLCTALAFCVQSMAAPHGAFGNLKNFINRADDAVVMSPHRPVGLEQASSVVESRFVPNRLTPRRYIGFLHEYLPGLTETVPKAVLTVLLVACGALVLCWKMPPLGIPLLCTLLLLPVPCMFVQVRHFYVSHYFCAVLPVLLLLWARGLVAAVNATVAVATKRSAAGSLTFLLLVLIGTLVAPTVLADLRRYYTTRPERDWKSIACIISPHLEQDDLIIYYTPWDWAYNNFDFSMSFYLPRYVSSSRSNMPRRVWCNTAAAVSDLLCQKVQQNVWVITDHVNDWSGLPQTEADALRVLTRDAVKLRNDPVYLLMIKLFAEPTANLCASAGFEYWPDVPSLPSWARWVDSTEAFAGIRALCITNDGQWQDSSLEVALPVRSTAFGQRRGESELQINDSEKQVPVRRKSQALLKPNKVYTLSMQAKNRNVIEGLFYVGVSGLKSDGKAYNSRLLRVPDITTDWRLISCRVVPGVDVPANATSLDIVVGLTPTVKGTLWIDNVQFEAKDHATSFTEGERLGHPGLIPSS